MVESAFGSLRVEVDELLADSAPGRIRYSEVTPPGDFKGLPFYYIKVSF